MCSRAARKWPYFPYFLRTRLPLKRRKGIGSINALHINNLTPFTWLWMCEYNTISSLSAKQRPPGQWKNQKGKKTGAVRFQPWPGDPGSQTVTETSRRDYKGEVIWSRRSEWWLEQCNLHKLILGIGEPDLPACWGRAPHPLKGGGSWCQALLPTAPPWTSTGSGRLAEQ